MQPLPPAPGAHARCLARLCCHTDTGTDTSACAADGLWDVMGNQEVVDLVQRHKDAKAAAEGALRCSARRASPDTYLACRGRHGRKKKQRARLPWPL